MIPKHIQPMLDCLNLTSTAPLRFQGVSFDFVGERIYGGQVLAQALMAALLTTDKLAHSLHAYFLVGGDATVPVDYQVEILRDGRSFSNRQVKAYQHDTLIFTAIVSCASQEQGLLYQVDAPTAIAPDALLNEQQLKQLIANQVPEVYQQRFMRERPLEFKPINPTNPFKPEPCEPKRDTWMRVASALPDDPKLHQAILAFASDYTLMSTGLMPHGIGLLSKNIQCASLDHTMHFNHTLKMDDWLLYHTFATNTQSSRGLNYGHFWQNNQLVASVSQEGLMRVIQPS